MVYTEPSGLFHGYEEDISLMVKDVDPDVVELFDVFPGQDLFASTGKYFSFLQHDEGGAVLGSQVKVVDGHKGSHIFFG